MKLWLGFTLALIGGFVDTTTFMGASGVFSAHVTGNFVLFAVALARGAADIDYLKLFLFLPFVAGIAVVAFASRLQKIGTRLEALMYLVIAILLLTSGIYFINVTELPSELFSLPYFFVLLPVFAMGIHNSLDKIARPTEPMTTVMTGNVTQMMLFLTGYRTENMTNHEAQVTKAKSIFRVIAGFATGCLLASWTVHHFALASLIAPGLATLAIAIIAWNNQTGK
jgi:uncharacterized membrane protein YoaK (UPF0700 family)